MAVLDDIQTMLLRKAIIGLRIETSYSPPIQLDDPFAPDAPPTLDAPNVTASWILNQLKPKLTVMFPAEKRISVAPYGEPDPEGFNRMVWPLRIGAAAIGGLAFVGLFTSVRWLLRLELSAPPTRSLPALSRLPVRRLE